VNITCCGVCARYVHHKSCH